MKNLYDGSLYEMMPEVLKTPESEAVSYAVSEGLKQILDYADRLMLYADLGKVPDGILNLLAFELRTQYYDSSASRTVREEMVKKTLGWYMAGGTNTVLEEYLGTLYSGGKVTEWYEYGGKPFYFKAVVTIPEDIILKLGESDEIVRRINRYKNVRSWLDALEFQLLFFVHADIRYESEMKFQMEFFPRVNRVPLLLDSFWKLDDSRYLNGWLDDKTGDLYPVRTGMLLCTELEVSVSNQAEFALWTEQTLEYELQENLSARVENRMKYEENLQIGDRFEALVQQGAAAVTRINLLDGTWKLSGDRYLNGGREAI